MNDGSKIGYARVSTREQNLDLQLDALKAAGCDQIFTDQGISGTAIERDGLTQALEAIGEGDTLVVWKLDRLGRYTPKSDFGMNNKDLGNSQFMSEKSSNNIDDIIWKEAGLTTGFNYIEQTSSMLSKEYLDDIEQERLFESVFVGKSYDYIFNDNHRSRWVANKLADSVFIHDNALTTDSCVRIEESFA